MMYFLPRHCLLLGCFLCQWLITYAQVPAPEEVIGFQMGADHQLADYAQITHYLKLLDAGSERVHMEQIGTSVLGKPLYLLFISSEENIRQLSRWKDISARLARARISAAEARQLSEQGKAIVWIDGGIHSSEKATTQFPPELAYLVATEESAEMQKIRDNVILLLMPNINPDGLDIVADWYRKQRQTPYENTQPPVLYHHYTGHDNNRDWFMHTQPETQAVSTILFREWYPQIVYNQHQSAPAWTKIFVPPFSKPVNPHIHPGVVNGVNLVGSEMASRFAREHKPGVISDIAFTMWWNGGLRTAPYFHNQIGILTETAHPSPAPDYYPPDSLPQTVGNGTPTNGTAVNYPFPWKGGMSHFREAVEYMLTASLATLSLGADRKEKWLYDMYRMGRDAIESQEGAYAYVVPAQQWDSGEAHHLINVLLQGGVEVHQADQAFAAAGNIYAKGTFVLYGAQAFRPYLADLMEPQHYPEEWQYPGGPPKTPYDLTGWTLPLQMGVRADRIQQAFEVKTHEVQAPVWPSADLPKKSAYGYRLAQQENASTKAVNELLAENAEVYWLSEAQEDMPAGTLLVKASDEQLTTLTQQGVGIRPMAHEPAVPVHKLHQPRIGLYKSWVANTDEGWTRWLLDQYGFVYDTLHDQDIQTGNLSAYDAIILPHQSPYRMLYGHRPNTMPPAYTQGLNKQGVQALNAYVKRGGTIIAFDEASDFAIEQLGLPVRNVTKSLTAKDFFIPGSLIRTVMETVHPLAYGMQDTLAVAFSGSRAFESIPQNDAAQTSAAAVAVAHYARENTLMSGWALGAETHIGGKAAVMQVGHGQGHVVLFGFRPQFRGQTSGTYKLIFNAIYQSAIEDLPAIQAAGEVAE